MVSLEEAAVMTIFVCGQFYYMFLANYVGQKLIDHSIHIVDETQVSYKFVYAFPPLSDYLKEDKILAYCWSISRKLIFWFDNS